MNGKTRKLSRIFCEDGNTIIVPVDDSLISGPFNGLQNTQLKLKKIMEAQPDAILAHTGIFKNHIIGSNVGRIINVSVSTVLGQHTHKVLSSTVNSALFYDADSVAAHINISSKYESQMLKDFGQLVAEAQIYNLPVTAIIYPRREQLDGTDDNYEELKESDCEKYSRLICHCVRVARDLGADIIKTQYTGNRESFAKVISAAAPIPVVIAGGEFVNAYKILQMAEDVIACGGKGVSFGRNIFSRKDSKKMIESISSIIHDGKDAQTAYSLYMPADDRED